MKKAFLLIVILSLYFLPAQGGEDGVIVRISKVYISADSRSESVGRLPAGESVSVFSRKGGWKEIFSKSRNVTGWVRSYQVREGLIKAETSKSESDSRGFLAGLASFSRRATGFFGGADDAAGTDRTATIGVRGLSEQQIKSARPDIEELEKLQSFSSNKTRMKTFASKGELSSHKLRHFKKKK